MKRSIQVMVWVCAVSVAAYAQEKPSDELTDPVEILKKVDSASKAVKAVKYKGTSKGTGAAESQRPTIEGTAIFTGWVGNFAEKYRFDAKIKRPGSSDVKEVTVISNGEEFALIDHTEKKAYVDIDPAVIGRTGGGVLQFLGTAEFVHATPFTDELNGDKQELKGSKTIGGVDCYEVDVTYASGRGRAIWHFSKKDLLPRGRHDIFSTASGEQGGQQKFLTDVEIDPKIDEDTFKIKVPEGYESVDDFAP